MKRYILLLAIGAILSGCASDSQKAEFVRSVIVTNPKTTDTETFKRFSGIINEGREIAVGFKTPGQISKLYAKEGDYVKEGQLLATLDDKDYKLGVEALEIQKNQLETELERLKKLYEAHSVS
ncbi:MAG: biotin/lipoyl-binding protein, partial [Bacteroidales bacterium]|nr:biotin/lipoyl-binding protein [Bacteroidales bacterium]